MDPFKCTRCGACCHFPPPPAPGEEPVQKKIPVYPEEARVLEQLAEERGVPLRLLEDFVLPDAQNQKILVGRYKILPDERGACPFYEEEVVETDGASDESEDILSRRVLAKCPIHKQRPRACHTYPIATKRVDAFNREYFIDPDCPVIQAQLDAMKGINPEEIAEIFPEEDKWAKKLDAREDEISLLIRQKSFKGEIEIPHEFTTEEFDAALRDWEREDLEPL
ncbi:MAG TPA: YkgJ family cysteine cluster protein [Candidatus Lokiarchaeia archaeon]|nr:YkgJ family cysteine cluster protein [Candidatus Lokiarchaeia archaeon]